MSVPITSHRLTGLEPDNLLAFLTLLGLLRSLGLIRPDWKPKAYWDFSKSPLRPVLTTCESTTEDMICAAANDGLKIFHQALFPFRYEPSKKEKPEKKPNKKQDKTASEKPRKALVTTLAHQRSLATRCIQATLACKPGTERHLVWQLRCDLIACSSVTAIRKKEKDKEIDTTPLELTSGNMAFIGAMFDLAERCKAEDIKESIFSRWEYAYQGNSLRFSPDEAQRYAYRASNPSDEGAYTELGATALSGLGLLSFPMVEAQKHWKMPAYSGTRSEGKICWPIWGCDGGKGSSLTTIEAMLRALPLEQTKSSKLYGPNARIAIARRYALDPSQPRYGNISRAEIEPISD
jgi:hypothetical protein